MGRKSQSFINLLEKDIPHSPWYISGNILPKGGTLLFGGESKIGKSFLALNMARNLSLGENLYFSPFITCQKCVVLYVEQEIGELGLQNRGSKLFYKADVESARNNFHYMTKEEILLNKPEGIKKLSDEIAEVKPNVLILDPIGKMHTYDENSASDLAELFTTFDRLKKINPEKNMSVVLSHHFKKPPYDKSNFDRLDPHNFRGSNRWFSDPDTVVSAFKMVDNIVPGSWRSWNIKVRFNLRQDESPDDMVFSFNKEPIEPNVDEGDTLIRYEYSVDSDNRRVSSVRSGSCAASNSSRTVPKVDVSKQVLMFRR